MTPVAPLARPAPGRPVPLRVPIPERWTLDNGLKIVAVPWSTLPQLGIRILIPAGSLADPRGAAGVAAFVGSMLTEGTTSRNADELNAELDLLGSSLGVEVGHDFTEIDLFLLAETLPQGMELLSEVVRSPSFPASETERVRSETLDALEARDDEPSNVADDHLASILFGEEHPYGWPAIGKVEEVERIDTDALRAFHSAYYRPAGAVMLVAGDFDLISLRTLIERTFGDWEGAVARPEHPPESSPEWPANEVEGIEWPEAAQGEIRFGGSGMPRTSPDWIPAALANYLLGGSTITGRLGANLREDKGWTYGIRSGFAAAVQRGGWVVETAVDGAVIDDALREITSELDRLMNEPVSEEELRRAKDALILSLPRAFETPGRIIGRFGTLEAFGLPLDYWERFPAAVEATTVEDVQRIARTYFNPDRLVRVVVGPP